MKANDNQLDDLMWNVMDNLVRLCHSVTDEEVARGKMQLKAALLTQQDSLQASCEEIGRQFLVHGRRVPLTEMLARVDAVTTASVREAAMIHINDKDHALAAIGPIFELPDYNWIRRRSYWVRY